MPKAGQTEIMNDEGERYKYTGQRQEVSIGLYYYGARYYDPDVGRFITEDTYRGELVDPQSQNVYIYTLNNPLKYVDPTGNYPIYKKKCTGVVVTFKDKGSSFFFARNENKKKHAKVDNAYENAINQELKAMKFEYEKYDIYFPANWIYDTFGTPSTFKGIQNVRLKDYYGFELGDIESDYEYFKEELNQSYPIEGDFESFMKGQLDIDSSGVVKRLTNHLVNTNTIEKKVGETINGAIKVKSIISSVKSMKENIDTIRYDPDEASMYMLDYVLTLPSEEANNYFKQFKTFSFEPIKNYGLDEAANKMHTIIQGRTLVDQAEMSYFFKEFIEASEYSMNMIMDSIDIITTLK
ncbi:MAG: RHS repeat-associated core domain-containing protein [bacterium]